MTISNEPDNTPAEPEQDSQQTESSSIEGSSSSVETTEITVETEQGTVQATQTSASSESVSMSTQASRYWGESSSGRKILTIVVVAAIAALLVLGCAALFNMITGSSDSSSPDATATPIAGGGTIVVPTPAPGVASLTATTNVNIRSGPGSDYPIIGILGIGESAEVIGVSADGQWWAIKSPDPNHEAGWVADQYVVTQNTDDVPVIVQPPLPTPTAAPPVNFSGWKGEYFDNPNLQGDPVLIRDDAEINFNWGTESPAAGMPADNWSARWTNTRDEVAAGTYRFSVWVDDGVRVWLDDVLIIDGWVSGNARNYTADVNVTKGTHSVRVEYFEGVGAAMIQLSIGYISEYPDWKGEYFDNPNVAGAPVVERNDREINFDWGTSSPAPGIPADNYSVRWSHAAFFEQGNYIFTIQVEGGVRMWFDGRLLIDDWVGAGQRTLQAESGQISRAYHDLRIDYFKSTGNGAIRATYQAGGQPTATPVPEAPAAIISAPSQAEVNEVVQFVGGESYAAQGNQIVTYEWAFGDGFGSNDINPTHAYSEPGVYQATLTVVDNNALTASTATQIQIVSDAVTVTPIATATQPSPEQGPTAVIAAPTQGTVAIPIPFDGSESFGPNPIVSYFWDFGDGTNANAVTIQHPYDRVGQFNVTLTVTDNAGLTNQTQTRITISAGEVTPTAPAPTPTQPPAQQGPAAVISAPTQAGQGVPVKFDASESFGTSPITTYLWDFGDGGSSSAELAEYTYGSAGVYNVSLTVTDSENTTDTTTTQITIVDAGGGGSELEGVNWVLNNTLPDSQIFALFQGGNVTGSGGCNNYNAAYTIDGTNITIANVTSPGTRCGAEIDQQEADYFAALQSASSHNVQGNQMILSGATTLNYTAAP